MPTFTTRRVVTAHDAEGNAVIGSDAELASVTLDDAADMRLVWSTDDFPSDNQDESDGAERAIQLMSPGGSALQITSMAPGSSSPHHRTVSMDYGIVLEGEIELELDLGQKVRLSAGDVVVQRGTIHTWRNVGTGPSKMAFVLLDAKPVIVNGEALEPGVRPVN